MLNRPVGTDDPKDTILHVYDSAKINVWCCLLHNKLIRRLCPPTAVATVNSTAYLDMLENYSFTRWRRKEFKCFDMTVFLLVTSLFLAFGEETRSLGLRGNMIDASRFVPIEEIYLWAGWTTDVERCV